MKSTANAPTARKRIHRKPKAQKFGPLRVEAFEKGAFHAIEVDVNGSRAWLTSYDAKRLVQWMHRFERWDTERTIEEQRKAQEGE